MNILVTGGNGQLGKALKKILLKKDSQFVDIDDFDIIDAEKTLTNILKFNPEIIIHTAAYTDVDGCEKNPELAFKVNELGTENICVVAKKVDAKVIYISTDFVFDGKKGSPYLESDQSKPLSTYGKSKLAGEKAVQSILNNYCIIRTSWLYGDGKNFVRTMLELAKTRDEVSVVCDQIGSPTSTSDLAEAINQLIKNPKANGIFHLTNAGRTNWADFAREILKTAKIDCKVNDITSANWQKIKPESAPRPRNSVLKNTRAKKLGIVLSKWQDGLKRYLK